MNKHLQNAVNNYKTLEKKHNLMKTVFESQLSLLMVEVTKLNNVIEIKDKQIEKLQSLTGDK